MMTTVPNSYPALYQAALQRYLGERRGSSLESARALGQKAAAQGLVPLDLAALHEEIMISEALPKWTSRQRGPGLKRAGVFFGLAIASMEKNAKPTARTTTAHLCRSLGALSQRCVELSNANLALDREIAERKVVEASLRDAQGHYVSCLAKAEGLQLRQRDLSRLVLTAQEEERKRISRELHDVVAQTLAGINIRLGLLKREVTLNTKGLLRNIALTQRLVKKSTGVVQQVARDLRPSMLDDLGLIPTLHAYLESFTDRTGIRSHLQAFAGVKDLDPAQSTVLFRISQEALTNVARHSHATQVEVSIQKLSHSVTLAIKDDGISFERELLQPSSVCKRLGILGMKERAEMIGGSLEIELEPGHGTVVRAQFPLANKKERPSKASLPLP